MNEEKSRERLYGFLSSGCGIDETIARKIKSEIGKDTLNFVLENACLGKIAHYEHPLNPDFIRMVSQDYESNVLMAYLDASRVKAIEENEFANQETLQETLEKLSRAEITATIELASVPIDGRE